MTRNFNTLSLQDASLYIEVDRLFSYPSIESLMMFFEDAGTLKCGYVEYLPELKTVSYPIIGKVISYVNGILTISYDNTTEDLFILSQIKYLTPKCDKKYKLNGLKE